MALLDLSIDDTADGKKFRLGHDPDTKLDVFVWVRSVPANVIEDCERRHRKRMKQKGPNGTRIVFEVPQSQKLIVAFEQAAYAWTECENFEVRVADKEAAALFNKEVGGAKLKAGDTVTLDGKLTDRLKIEIFNRNTKIYEKITEMANSLDEENIDEEAEHTSNLSDGSNGGSNTQRSQKDGVAAAE